MKLNETSSVDSNRRCRRFLEGDTNDAATGGLHNDCEIHQDADGRALWLGLPLGIFLLQQKITVWGTFLLAAGLLAVILFVNRSWLGKVVGRSIPPARGYAMVIMLPVSVISILPFLAGFARVEPGLSIPAVVYGSVLVIGQCLAIMEFLRSRTGTS